MNTLQFTTVRTATLIIVVFAIAAASLKAWSTSDRSQTIEANSYHNQCLRPTLVLLYDQRTEGNWRKAASNLSTHFHISFIDTAQISIEDLHNQIATSASADYRISSSKSANTLLEAYTEHYGSETTSFELPHNSQDLFELTLFFHQIMDTASDLENESES